MALSKQQLYQKDRKWIWKFTLRIIAIVFAWVAGGCVVSMTHRLRISMFSGGNGYDQANMFILPSLLMTLALSVLWNASNIFTTLYSSHCIPFGANLACDILLAFSLLVSGIWLCVATTSSYNTLHIYIDGEYTEYCDGITEMIGIAFTFLTAFLHIPLLVSSAHNIRIERSRPYNPHNNTHHLTSKDIYHVHPALRPPHLSSSPVPSPLPYPNPNHPTCAYPANTHPANHPTLTPRQPPPAYHFHHQASPLGVHVPTRTPTYLAKVGVLEDAGGLLPAEKTVEERVGEKERWRGGGGDVEMGMVGRGSEGGGGRF